MLRTAPMRAGLRFTFLFTWDISPNKLILKFGVLGKPESCHPGRRAGLAEVGSSCRKLSSDGTSIVSRVLAEELDTSLCSCCAEPVVKRCQC